MVVLWSKGLPGWSTPWVRLLNRMLWRGLLRGCGRWAPIVLPLMSRCRLLVLLNLDTGILLMQEARQSCEAAHTRLDSHDSRVCSFCFCVDGLVWTVTQLCRYTPARCTHAPVEGALHYPCLLQGISS